MAELLDLIPACGTPNPPGTNTKIFVVSVCDVDTFPAKKVTTNPGDTVTLDGDIVLKANKAFKEFKVISETGVVKNTLVGVPGSRGFESTFDGKIRGVGPIELEWLERMVANDESLIVIVEDNAGVNHVIGTDKAPAGMETAETTTGDAIGSERTITFQVKQRDGFVAPIYEGAIDLDPLT